jgi:hypothetical protein
MKTSKVGNLLGEVSFVINGAWWHVFWLQDTVRDSNAVIIFTESGCLVNDTSSIRVSHVGVNKHPKGFILELQNSVN